MELSAQEVEFSAEVMVADRCSGALEGFRNGGCREQCSKGSCPGLFGHSSAKQVEVAGLRDQAAERGHAGLCGFFVLF